MVGSLRAQRVLSGNSLLLASITLVGGFLHAAATGWPIHALLPQGQALWWMQTGAMAACVLMAIRAATPAIAARRAWAFATVWLASTFWWLFVAMNNYGGLPAILAAIAVLALAGALGGYYAVAIWLWRKLPTTKPAHLAVAFGALWMMAELARGTWLTGFGWGAIGYAHVDGPLAYFLPWLGSYGVSALAAMWSASIGMTLLHGRWVPAFVISALLLLPTMFPASWNSWTAPSQTLNVTLLQGNIPQDEKFEPGSGVPLALQWYQQALEQATGDLVVAPETAIPLLPQQLPVGYWDALSERFGSGQQSALIGIPLGSYQIGYTNSVIGITPGATQVWQYDKHHLVPFGEFIPPLFKWFTQLMNIPLGDFNRGSLGQPSLDVRGERVAPNICYEDLYGEELATRFVDPARAPTIFANVSNLGWFNDTVALQQHLNISRVRALEFQRPFARATNTGATAILSHEGQVLEVLPPRTRAVLHGSVQGRTGLTPFAWWASRFGLWPLWLLGVGLLALSWRRRRT